ncbi:hypothetical protein CJU90_5706 [Yarrowia sp. C11]|nr:hypothetical protein CJU90_5706 [Yarrowia sp. C11]KAG5364288.1 hypothetical protein CKK34_3084 [Yarrowia sp. E02]
MSEPNSYLGSSFSESPLQRLGGRSYSRRPSILVPPSVPNMNEGLRHQSAELANMALEECMGSSPAASERPKSSGSVQSYSMHGSSLSRQLANEPLPIPDVIETPGLVNTERDSLRPKKSAESKKSIPAAISGVRRDSHRQYHTFGCPDIETGDVNHGGPRRGLSGVFKRLEEKVASADLVDECVKKPISYLPSVVLGTLLNILDGLSYGMILFPLSEPIFAHLGPAGLSMFYMSCVISQLVYSLGGSAFKAGIGSEMIEVVPFFHSMAYTLMAEIKEPERVIPTVILSFAASSVVTGLVFLALGAARLGSLISFFPRHILVGCIGGVGWFLCVTGIEVSSRMDGPLEYTFSILKFLLEPRVLLMWGTPLFLALALLGIQRFSHHPLIVPSYFCGVFAIFHLLVWAVPSWNLQMARDSGWVFSAQATSEPWWYYYTLYDFGKTDWGALVKTVPAMFALTFFGILHVPINVPALAVSTGQEDINVDRELLAHGISNGLSGLLGSIQNYLVYTNSVLFIKSGADSRVAGVMLALATAGVMFAGPVVIGFIPVCVVGALIFLLGIELLIEALGDTWGRLSRFEYITVLAIVLTMGIFDFVYGILFGIVLACFSFVIQSSQRSVIKATYTGAVARSTVRRHATQQKFLQECGNLIYLLKLSGYMFFGTIVRVEDTIKQLMDDAQFSESPFRYLILDMTAVSNIDFSAAEAFIRIKKLLDSKNVYLVMSGIGTNSPISSALGAVGLWKGSCTQGTDVRLFSNLNEALEWCENEFLSLYYSARDDATSPTTPGAPTDIPSSAGNRRNTLSVLSSSPGYSASPRISMIHRAATNNVKDDPIMKWNNFKQPLPLLLQVSQGLTNENEDFWFRICAFFKKEVLPKGSVLYTANQSPGGFYLVQSGILRADYDMQQGRLYETILAGTTCGELPFFSETYRTATVTAEVETTVWKMDAEAWKQLQQLEPDGQVLANELLKVVLKLTAERFESITKYVLISAN